MLSEVPPGPLFTNHWYRKVHGANMGPIWGRQDPGGPLVGPINFAIWDVLHLYEDSKSPDWYLIYLNLL